MGFAGDIEKYSIVIFPDNGKKLEQNLALSSSITWTAFGRIPRTNRLLPPRHVWCDHPLVGRDRRIRVGLLHFLRHVDRVSKMAHLPLVQEATEPQEARSKRSGRN